MGKADKMQEQIGNVSRERGNPKNELRRTEKDGNVKGAVMPLMSLLVDWTWLGKESLSLRTYE